MNERTIIEAAIFEDEQKAKFGQGKEAGEQQTIQWIMERLGFASGSRFKDVLDFQKTGKPGAKRTTYLWELVSERLTGKPIEHFVNAAMEWGNAYEDEARMQYESQTGNMVMQQGFIHHPTVAMCGGSVDGTIDDDGIIEIKCPTTSTHLKTVLSGECEHLPQIMGYLWITGRKWCDFVSYDPRLPEPLNLHIQRIDADDEYIANLDREVQKFLAEVADIVTKLKEAA